MSRSTNSQAIVTAGLAALILTLPLPARAAPVGLFEDHRDVGATRLAGSARFDAATGAYTVSGGGANMWFTNDAFHFVWKQIPAGDVTLAADIRFPEPGGDPHRKACLLVRQNLDPDAAYADAVLHGDGLTSLQYRAAARDRTYEIQAGVAAPQRLRLEKRGRYVSLSVAGRTGCCDRRAEPSGSTWPGRSS